MFENETKEDLLAYAQKNGFAVSAKMTKDQIIIALNNPDKFKTGAPASEPAKVEAPKVEAPAKPAKEPKGKKAKKAKTEPKPESRPLPPPPVDEPVARPLPPPPADEEPAKTKKGKGKKAKKAEEPKEESWENVVENIVKRDGRKVAYGLVQRKGKEARIVIGAYATILDRQLREDSKPSKAWEETTVKTQKGEEKAWIVPMKKGHVSLTPAEVKALVKGL